MPNKLDKFGMKFCLLAVVDSKYLCNGKPYLGKDSPRQKGNNFPKDTCLTLLDPYFRKGYNVTIDHFFTSINLAEKLLFQRTPIWGTTLYKKAEKRGTEHQSCGKKQTAVFLRNTFLSFRMLASILLTTVALLFTRQKRKN